MNDAVPDNPGERPNNRRLDADELGIANQLLAEIRKQIEVVALGDRDLAWALRRKIYKELIYDERSKPAVRRALKAKLRARQSNLCAVCGHELPNKGTVTDRLQAMLGYTEENTRLLCPACDAATQAERGYA